MPRVTDELHRYRVALAAKESADEALQSAAGALAARMDRDMKHEKKPRRARKAKRAEKRPRLKAVAT